MKNGKLQAIDLFSGAGGLSQGLKQAEFQVIGAVEFVENFAKSYELNHPKTKMYNVDIRELDPIMLKRTQGFVKDNQIYLQGIHHVKVFLQLELGTKEIKMILGMNLSFRLLGLQKF